MIAPSKVAKRLGRESIDPTAAALQRIKSQNRSSSPPPSAEDPPEVPRSSVSTGKLDLASIPVQWVPIAKLVRHPKNRHPTPAAIASMAASIKSEGLIEPPLVRRLGDALQIISGETRYLGRKENDAKSIFPVKILEHCSDARALELLAICNAKRTDLSPIEKAQMILDLCMPIANGGSGMTREQAAKIYGFKNGSAASSLIGLLSLPKCWQDVVASGEFPQTFARILIPYAPAAAALERLFKSYQADLKSKFSWEREQWESRDEVESTVDNQMYRLLRPIEKGLELVFDTDLFVGKIPKGTQAHRYSGRYPCLFELTPETEAKLGIVKLQIDPIVNGKKVTKPLRYATNLEEYDKLQVPKIIARVDKGAKKSHGSAGDEKPKKISPAEEKQAVAERVKLFKARVDHWRHAWLKRILADAFSNSERCPTWQAYRFALWLAGNDPLSNSIGATEFLEDMVPAKSIYNSDFVSGISEETLPDLAHKFAAACFSHVDKNPKYTAFETADLEAFARDLQIDLAAEWLELPQEELETFLDLHQGAQLEPLAKDWDIFLKPGSGRAERIKVILGSGNKKPLPKCVPAIAAGKKGGK